MEKLRFKCGCEFDVFKDGDEYRVQFNPDIKKLNLECSAVWQLLGDGNTLGVFQIESQLGQGLSKKLKPNNLEDIAALVSIMRPGCLESKIDNKSVTDRYIDRKNGLEGIDYYHPALENALKKTYGLLVYQESALAITKDIAGFSLGEAELLRKSIGKKLTDKMAEAKTLFLVKAKETNIVSEKEAEEIFNGIEKSQRYAFNKSHAFSYAKNTFVSAFIKAHFPVSFFTSWLYWSSPDFEEIAKLTRNAKSVGINVTPLDFRVLNGRFKKYGKEIRFGTSDIRGIGHAMLEDVMTKTTILEGQFGPRSEWKWTDFLVGLSPQISVTAAKGLIGSGALDYYNLSRTQMLSELDDFGRLTGREAEFVKTKHIEQKFTSLAEALSLLIACGTGKKAGISRKDRVVKIESIVLNIKNPSYKLVDSPAWKAGTEAALYGLPLTCTTLDQCDISEANCTIKEFLDGKGGYCIIPAQISSIREHVIQNGRSAGSKMAFISVSDSENSMESVIAFSEVWALHSDVLVVGNNVMLCGEKGRNDGFVLKNVYQI